MQARRVLVVEDDSAIRRGLVDALQFAGYDYKTVWGDGGHNGKHGGAIFPEAMRWLWRSWRGKNGH